MGLFFGTDGIRGKVNVDLTFDIAYKIGNALAKLKTNPKIIVGCDTRTSASLLTAGLAGGAMNAGAIVIDIGIVPTAGIAYITKEVGADYGVVISASHNSGEYNGIKVFNHKGYKLCDKEEEAIERCFIHDKTNAFPNMGKYEQDFSLVKLYKKFLIQSSEHKFNGLTIVLDCAHGAAHRIAPEVFRALGAKVIASNCALDGLNINNDCGALYPENLIKKVKIRADRAGVFFGTLTERNGTEVTLKKVGRLGYWDGASSLSQLAVDGTKAPGSCKFTVTVEEMTVFGVIEIIPCTEKAIKSIEGVREWKR